MPADDLSRLCEVDKKIIARRLLPLCSKLLNQVVVKLMLGSLLVDFLLEQGGSVKAVYSSMLSYRYLFLWVFCISPARRKVAINAS
jgi:hypothetical protein